MPTTYTSDSDGAPLAPDLGQTPEGSPKLALPIDGEAANAASIAQAFKTLGNWLARAMKPKGSTVTTNRYLWRGRTSLGHTRFALDRNGLPAGTYLQKQEAWQIPSAIAGLPAGALPNYGGQWSSYASTPTATGLAFVHVANGVPYPGVPNSRVGVVAISAGDVLNEFYGLLGVPLCSFDADADIAWETNLYAEDSAGVTKPDLTAGIYDQSASFTDPRTVPGCYFWRDITQTNWQAVCRNGVSETVVDTGIAVSGGTHLRARIEFRGANVNDGGVRTAYFFLGQLPAATITTTVPTGGSAAPGFFAKNTHGTAISRPSGPGDIYIGPLNMACNVMPSVTT